MNQEPLKEVYLFINHIFMNNQVLYLNNLILEKEVKFILILVKTDEVSRFVRSIEN